MSARSGAVWYVIRQWKELERPTWSRPQGSGGEPCHSIRPHHARGRYPAGPEMDGSPPHRRRL